MTYREQVIRMLLTQKYTTYADIKQLTNGQYSVMCKLKKEFGDKISDFEEPLLTKSGNQKVFYVKVKNKKYLARCL